jgi:hypothetical protein
MTWLLAQQPPGVRLPNDRDLYEFVLEVIYPRTTWLVWLFVSRATIEGAERTEAAGLTG